MNKLRVLTLFGMLLTVGIPIGSRDVAIAGGATEAPRDTRSKYILFSKKTDNGGFKFTIFPYERNRIIRFESDSGRQEIWVTSLDQLGKLFAQLPQHSVIVWTDDVRKHMVFPPSDVVRRAKEFARKTEIDLQVISSFYD